MTFVTAWRGSLESWTLSPLPVTGHRSWLAAVRGDSSSLGHADVVAPGWCCKSESPPLVGAVLPGQWQAWELYAATPYARQTLKGKAN